MMVHYFTYISYHVTANSFLSAWPPFSFSLSHFVPQTLYRPQSPEHFQAGHAPPGHPFPCGARSHEEAV